MPPSPNESIAELRRRIAALRSRGAGGSGGWPNPYADRRRFDRSHWFVWEREGARVLVFWCPSRHYFTDVVRVLLFDQRLELIRWGEAERAFTFGEAIEFRASDPRLPEAVRDRWLLGAVRTPYSLEGTPSADREYRLSNDILTEHSTVQPVDWFGDDFDWRSLPLLLSELEGVEFRELP